MRDGELKDVDVKLSESKDESKSSDDQNASSNTGK